MKPESHQSWRRPRRTGGAIIRRMKSTKLMLGSPVTMDYRTMFVLLLSTGTPGGSIVIHMLSVYKGWILPEQRSIDFSSKSR